MQVDVDIDGLKLAKMGAAMLSWYHWKRACKQMWILAEKKLGKTCGATIVWYCWNFFGLGMEVGSGIGA